MYGFKDEALIAKFPHYERMLDELFELNNKIDSLKVFISNPILFKRIPEEEQALLTEQLSVMIKYSDILNKRIANIRAM